jgi:hypothetical protein
MEDTFSNFDDSSQSGIMPNYKAIPTNVRSGRSFLLIQSALPRMYYVLEEQDRRAKLKLTKQK